MQTVAPPVAPATQLSVYALLRPPPYKLARLDVDLWTPMPLQPSLPPKCR